VTARGDLDSATADDLAALLSDRLWATPEHLTVDLSEVDFLGVAGVRVQLHAALQLRTAPARHHHELRQVQPVVTEVPAHHLVQLGGRALVAVDLLEVEARPPAEVRHCRVEEGTQAHSHRGHRSVRDPAQTSQQNLHCLSSEPIFKLLG